MLCFRDITFCESDCTNTACHRNLNDEVRAAAKRWWSGFPGEAPIAMRNMSEGCESYQPAAATPAITPSN